MSRVVALRSVAIPTATRCPTRLGGRLLAAIIDTVLVSSIRVTRSQPGRNPKGPWAILLLLRMAYYVGCGCLWPGRTIGKYVAGVQVRPL